MPRRRSIRAHLTTGFAAALAAAVTAAGGAWIASEWTVQHSRVETLLRGTERRVRDELADAHPDLREIAEDLEHSGDGVSLELLRPDGSRLALTRGPLPPAKTLGSQWLVREIPDARGTVRIAFAWEPIMRRLTQEALSLVALGLLGTALATVGAWLLVGRTLQPIRKLVEQAEKASVSQPEGDLPGLSPPGPLLSAPSEDVEMVELVETLNGLLQRQARTVAARSQFYATASHELRTPLQALAGHLELALARRRSVPEYEAAIREASLQTGRLVELTRDLLLLHQLESGQLSSRGGGTPTVVSLLAAQQRSARLLHPIMEQRSVAVRVELSGSLVAAAPPGQVDALVRNLLENAVRYAPQGSTVEVAGGVGEGTAYFRVVNEREEGARGSRSSEADRHGLGLAICRAIVEHNGWRWEWCESEGLVRVTVRFALAEILTGPDRSQECNG
jgi:signal transduction histidine kinase